MLSVNFRVAWRKSTSEPRTLYPLHVYITLLICWDTSAFEALFIEALFIDYLLLFFIIIHVMKALLKFKTSF